MALVCLAPRAGWTFDLHLRIEPGVAIPVAAPQSSDFKVGGGLTLKGGISLWDLLDLELAGHYAGMPATPSAANTELGTLWGVGGGLRLHFPRTGFVSPWLDADVLYVRTGPLNRLGFSVGGGMGFALDAMHSWWLGPFARYAQVVQPERVGYDNTDAKILLAGLSLEVGSPGKRAPIVVDTDHDGIFDNEDACPEVAGVRSDDPHKHGCPPAPAPGDGDKDGITDDVDQCPDEPQGFHPDPARAGCPVRDRDGDGVLDADDRCPDIAGPQQTKGCPDHDNDGLVDIDDQCPDVLGPIETGGCPDRDLDHVADRSDFCPDVPGPASNHGCPKYKTVTLTLTKLEIASKIYFAHDSSKILPKSFPVLNDVTGALKDARTLRVRVEGHTDSAGKAKHNQLLSEQRAGSVVAYLVKKGISAERLQSAGYGSTQALDTNATVNGREHNRRVEFVILNEGTLK